MFGRTAVVSLVGAGTAFALAMAGGCGGNNSGVSVVKLPDGVRDETIGHEVCDESGNRVENLDANHDGKADVRVVYARRSSVKLCIISDLNRDGRPDFFEYYDGFGMLRRREAGYDDSGTIDSVEVYEQGRLVTRELDTTGQHRIDTWEFYDKPTGKLLRRERDTTNDGRIDQWTTFDDKHQTISFDKDGDGRPDSDGTVVLNLDGTPVDEEEEAKRDAGAAVARGASLAADASAAPVRSSASAADSATDAGADGGKRPVRKSRAKEAAR